MNLVGFRDIDQRGNTCEVMFPANDPEIELVRLCANGGPPGADLEDDLQIDTSCYVNSVVLDGQTTDHCQYMDTLCEALESVDMTQSDSVPLCIPTFDADCIYQIVYSQDTDGDTLLHSAIIALKEQLVEQFINIAPSCDQLNIRNNLKQTPLHLAVLTKQVRVVRALVVGGADILSRDRDGNTPLHVACREGFIEIVRTLLEPVRYPEIKHTRYDIPYQRIPQDTNITNYDGIGCLHLAASGGHRNIVKLLLDKHADINCRDIKSGRTILHNACNEGNLELVKLIMQYRDCNINARTYNNLTPLELARDRGYLRITFELAAAGAMAANELEMDDY